MRPDRWKTAVLTACAVATGWVGWSGHLLLLPIAIAYPYLWSRASSRSSAVLVSAGYFLAASRGLPQGVAAFYQSDLLPGVVLWLLASSSFVFVHSALWTQQKGLRSGLAYLAAMVLTALPPFGILGWAHPISAAGVIFAGWGWLGLGAMAAGLSVMTTRYWPVAALTFSCLWVWSVATWVQPHKEDRWQGVNLVMGSRLGRDPSLTYHRDLHQTIDKSNGQVIVLPESALGLWTPTAASLWQSYAGAGAKTIVAGAAVVRETGYDNVLVMITGSSSEVVYLERMPVPGSMWQPWRQLTGWTGGARAHLFANPVVDIAGKTVAPLICYEQLVVWPILQSMLLDPELIVAVGNGWWTAGTSIVEIQKMSVDAWARLFDRPFVTSFNTSGESKWTLP
ncbi:Carbon-nitrogen hydrolase [compost metagenome]